MSFNRLRARVKAAKTRMGCRVNIFLGVLIAVVTSFVTPTAVADDTKALPLPKILILGDLTGSVKENRVPSMSDENLRQAEDINLERGGELAVGTIDGRSKTSLVRLTVNPPPTPRKADSGNMGVYEVAMRREADRLAQERWRSGTNASVEPFHASALKLLRGDGTKAETTDVVNALRRAAVYFSEDGVPDTLPILVCISDGLHTAGRPQTVELPVGVTVVVVNGNGTTGMLQAYAPHVFEAIEPALRFVAERARGKR